MEAILDFIWTLVGIVAGSIALVVLIAIALTFGILAAAGGLSFFSTYRNVKDEDIS